MIMIKYMKDKKVYVISYYIWKIPGIDQLSITEIK